MRRIAEPHPQPRDRIGVAVGVLEILADAVTVEPLEQLDRKPRAGHGRVVVDHDRDRDRLADGLEVGVEFTLVMHLIPGGDEQDPVVARLLGETAALDGVGRRHPGPAGQQRHAAAHLLLHDPQHLLPLRPIEVHELARARTGAESVGASLEHELDVIAQPRFVDRPGGGERRDERWVEAAEGGHGRIPRCCGSVVNTAGRRTVQRLSPREPPMQVVAHRRARSGIVGGGTVRGRTGLDRTGLGRAFLRCEP